MMPLNDKNVLFTLVFLSLTIWVAHFLNFLNFGLYEDDYAVISGVWRTPDFLNDMKGAITGWSDGRPLGYLLMGLFSFIGERIGGLHLIYVMGYLVITSNAFLFYLLLRRVSTETLAITGALALCLFPADTTHSFLTHSLSLQVSVTFLLTASLLYLSGKRISPYIVIVGSLLTYESPYMVFLAIPLLRAKWDKVLVKELFRHVAIMAGIVLVAVVIRIIMGEGRVGGMRADISGILAKIASALVIGPAVSMIQFFNAPIRAVLNWNNVLTVVSSASVPVFAWMVHRSGTVSSENLGIEASVNQKQAAGRQNTARDNGLQMRMWQLYTVSVLMLALAYTLSFTHYPPIASYGRATSVHLSSAVGGSLLFSCICTQIITISEKFRLRSFAIILISLYMSLILAYRLLIQDDFVRAWQNQRSFWANVLDVAPDMREDTIIFVVNTNLRKTNFILSNSWADPIIPSQLFNFPAQWANPPRLFAVNRIWFKAMIREGNHFKWMVPTALLDAHWEIIPDRNVILLDMENGRLIRRFGSINIDGLDFNLKDMPPGARLNYEKGPLFDYLIGG
jgi:hypothetical protein